MTRRLFAATVLTGAVKLGVPLLAAAEDLHLLLVPGGKSFHAGDPIRITWLIENRSKNVQSVIAYHDAGGAPQFSDLLVSVSYNNGPWQSVPLGRPGSAGQAVWRDLEAGATLFQQFDLAAAMMANGIQLQPGSWRVKGEYSLTAGRSTSGRASWVGHIATDQPVDFTLS